MMNCPRCEIPLEESQQIDVDTQLDFHSCKSCDGLWLSKPVLNYLEKIKEPVIFEFLQIDSELDQLIGLDCPSCEEGNLMKKAEHPRDERVIMDYCEACEGIWLDKGELRAIQQEGLFDSLAKFIGLY